MKNTKDLLIDLVHNVEATLETNEFGGLPHEVFLEWCIEELTEAGETEDLVLSNFDKRGEAIHGYSFSDHDGRLDLYITSYRKSTEPYTIQKNELNTLKKKECCHLFKGLMRVKMILFQSMNQRLISLN